MSIIEIIYHFIRLSFAFIGILLVIIWCTTIIYDFGFDE